MSSRMAELGSSPRMRGARERGGLAVLLNGIIPAYAGSTQACLFSCFPLWDHPRVCGEHLRDCALHQRVWGSSPRMRGAPHGRRAGQLLLRIIPAYAGSTYTVYKRYQPYWDHPRVCGEHAPLARQLLAKGRIIPAYAGSTLPSRDYLEGGRDHPRVCGEHRPPESRRLLPSGSSPRMRGAPLGSTMLELVGRIIPAYAGSTHAQTHEQCQGRDHPRVCGEHSFDRKYPSSDLGSSPRMRGARWSCTAASRIGGIIPAYAGSTSRWVALGVWHQDHPRVCGEHSTATSLTSTRRGSSPRMRGALVHDLDVLLVLGIIPAYAGSTSVLTSTGALVEDHPRVCGEY